ncbi:MAG: ATP-binding cassette domain-containing protein [Phycisphaerales bacterium]|nr:ATP-binding cassette domain-containing protein [Phycisphaerales bacterium]
MSRPASTSSALSIRALSFHYPTRGSENGFHLGIEAFDLARGSECLLVGRSGGGKSTFLQLVAGLLEPQHGSITLDGVELFARTTNRDLLRGAKLGFVFQTFNLLQGFSALENLLVALMFSTLPKAEWSARGETLLAALGIEQPNARVEELSVGQQQRVAIARALVCKPALVLADEPTASLDPENAKIAITLLREHCRIEGAALLVVSHDPSLVPMFARVEQLSALTAEGVAR